MKECKVLIIVNKDFEYAGYRAGVEYQMTANKAPDVKLVERDASIGPNKFKPSCVYEIINGNTKYNVLEFCISYMFGKNEVSSNSEIKYGHLIKFISDEKPDFVISVSTSESTLDSQMSYESINGCVIIGNTFYARDCREFENKPEDPQPSKLPIPKNWMSKDSKLNGDLFNYLNEHQENLAEGMERVPFRPFKTPLIFADMNYISLGVINIVHYDLYKKGDPKTYEEFKEYNKSKAVGLPVGLETTHAVIRKAIDDVFPTEKAKRIPELFISPIVDRYLHFDDDVDGTWGEQNKIGSYNAGVAVINILQNIFAHTNLIQID